MPSRSEFSMVIVMPGRQHPGITADLYIQYSSLKGTGTLMAWLSPEYEVCSTNPDFTFRLGNDLTWNDLPGPHGLVRIRVNIDHGARPGTFLTMRATLADGLDNRVEGRRQTLIAGPPACVNP